MASRICAGLLVSIHLLTYVAAAEQPFVATVSVDDVAVRSGPGEAFYGTSKLRRGDSVEVYRIDKSDWCAIRPPQGSFSLVRGRDVTRIAGSDVVTVKNTGVRSRVGSQISDRKNVQYVRLQKGEKLALLDPEAIVQPNDWLKVSPPSGEFRWIHTSQISRQGDLISATATDSIQAEAPLEPLEAASALTNENLHTAVQSNAGNSDVGNSDVGEPNVRESTNSLQKEVMASQELQASLASSATVASELAASPIASDAAGSNSTMTTEPIPSEPEPKAKLVSEKNEPTVEQVSPEKLNVGWTARQVTVPEHISPAHDPLAPAERPYEHNVTSNQPVGTNAGTTSVLSDFNQQLENISLQLSKTVTGEVPQWNLPPIRQVTERLIGLAQNQQQRLRASELLQRINEFENVKSRVTGAELAGTVNQRGPNQVAGQPSYSQTTYPGIQRATYAQTARAAQKQLSTNVYDGAGWLMPVLTSRADLPKYALTDDAGRILHFVSPRAGLNLRPFVKKRIGVIGQKGYLPQLKKSHLSAARTLC